MKKFLLLLIFAICAQLSLLGEETGITTFVTIMPQKYFVKQIGGQLVSVNVMIPSGRSPENFDPTPKQIVDLGNADIYFTVGIPMENMFLSKLRSGNHLTICQTDAGITKIMEKHEEHGEHHEHGEYDPHIWTDPVLVKEMARNIAAGLQKIAPEHSDIFQKNLDKLLSELDDLDTQISAILKPYAGRTFYTYHSALTYFAQRYGLVQRSIETGEKEPSPAKLREIVSQAAAEKINTIFIQPEFPASGATAVASAIHGKTDTISVLNSDYMRNMLTIAEKIAASMNK